MHVQTLLNWTVIKVFDSIFPPLIANPKYYFENRYHITLHHTNGLSFNWGSSHSLFPLYNISLLFSFLVSQSYTGPSQFNPLDLILSCLIFLYFMLIYLDMHLRTALDYFYSLYQTLFLFTPVDLYLKTALDFSHNWACRHLIWFYFALFLFTYFDHSWYILEDDLISLANMFADTDKHLIHFYFTLILFHSFDLSWYALDDYYWFFSWIFLWTLNYLDISWIVFMFLVNYLRGPGDWHIVWGCLVKGLVFLDSHWFKSIQETFKRSQGQILVKFFNHYQMNLMVLEKLL